MHAWAGGNWVILRNHLLALNMGLILVLITVLYRVLGGKEETHKGLVLRRALERLYQVWSYCKYLFVVIPVSFSKMIYV